MTSLIDLAHEAAAQVEQFRHPNVSEFVAAIDPILAAYGECTIGNDTVEDVTVGTTELYITTAYSVRGCSDKNDIRIPIAVLTAPDPVLAANQRRLSAKLVEYRKRIENLQTETIRLGVETEKIEAELRALSN